MTYSTARPPKMGTIAPSRNAMTDRTAAWNPGVEYATITDPGLRRSSNQDTLAVVIAPSEEAWRERGHLLMVADGMGAHAAGELASKMSSDLVPLTYQKLVDQPPITALRQAFEDANEKINGRGKANAEFHGMGTTTSALLLLPEGAVVAHVGDSRVYRLRGSRLEQLSFDHSLFWEMTAGGQVRDNEVPLLIPKNIITRSLGPNPQVQVDLEGPFPYQAGDTFMLCSDGLTGLVQDDEIGAILQAIAPAEAVQVLTDLANLRGGPDNITVLVARVGAPLVPEAMEPAPAAPGKSAARVYTAVLVLGGLATAGLSIAAGWLALAGRVMQAAVLAIAAGLSAAGLVERRMRTREKSQPTQPSDRLGRGPYTDCNCADPRTFAEKLELLSEQIRQAALAEGWTIDWSEFQARGIAAHEALASGRAADAVRESCHGLRDLMQQVRRRRNQAQA